MESGSRAGQGRVGLCDMLTTTPTAGKAPTKPNNERPNLNNGYLQANAHEDLSSTAVSPLLGQQLPQLPQLLPAQQQHQQQQQQLPPPQQQLKLPTVVFLSPDGSGAVGSALQRNAPAVAVGAAPGSASGTAPAASAPAVASDWLLLKEAQHRRRLLILAIAFTVLGAAIGALAIYFASVHQRCQLHPRSGPQDAGDGSFNLDGTHNNICMTQECVRT
ncbi:hypothetical protein AWZ03_014035, partial [Drosophila navojoa]